MAHSSKSEKHEPELSNDESDLFSSCLNSQDSTSTVKSEPSRFQGVDDNGSLDANDSISGDGNSLNSSSPGEKESDGEEPVEFVSDPNTKKRVCVFKVLVIGEVGTGKTSIIKRYVHHFFSENYRPTIGVDFANKVLNWDTHTVVRLQLWDIAGQERFGNMTRVYYKQAVGAFIVFDVTRNSTFEAVMKWKNDLDNKVQFPDGSNIPCVLLANKCDQPKVGMITDKDKMDSFCVEKGFSGWFETSAKEDININQAVKQLISKIFTSDGWGGEEGSDKEEKLDLTTVIPESTSNCSC